MKLKHIDRDKFFDAVRVSPFKGNMSQKQVDGLNYLLDVFERDYNWPDPRWLAYALATAYHEVAYTMMPIKEYGSQSYLQSKAYFPYFGRGYVQLTWEDNYRRMGQKLGVDLLGKNKDRALEPEIAAAVLYSGMRDGDFTKKKLADYFNASKDDPVNARRIVNGTDKAKMIAGYHRAFLEAIKASEKPAEPVAPPPAPIPPPPADKPSAPTPDAGRGLAAWVLGAAAALLAALATWIMKG
jgi:putative chitinase